MNRAFKASLASQFESNRGNKEQEPINRHQNAEQRALLKSIARLAHARSRVAPATKSAAEEIRATGPTLPANGAKPATPMMLPQGSPDFPAAMLDPHNRIGGSAEDLLSGNYNWALGILSLSGRAGLDLDLALSYNSLATWVRSGNFIDFDYDNGFPTPGFRLSFPVVDGYLYYNPQAGAYYYLLFTSTGQRVELRRVIGSSNVYEAVDSSYLQLTDYGSYLLLKGTDGSQFKLYNSMGQYRCTEIKDRNGNYITINYNSYDTLSISTITDTLGRTITFNYDTNGNLSTITQQWHRDVVAGGQQTETHQWANFSYGTQYIANNFSGLTVYGPVNQNITVLTAVNLPDGSQYSFDYNNYGQVKKITCKTPGGGVLNLSNYVSYDLPTSSSDCPRISARHDMAAQWNNNAETTTTFGSDGGSARWMGAPDGTVYKEFYGTGWQTGLRQTTEFWDWSGTKQKWITISWTQDNTNANPRVSQSDIYDAAGNHRGTHIDYTALFGLPYVVTEYGDAGTARITVHGYKNDDAYISRRIIGLPYQDYVFEGNWQLVSKIGYEYDWHDGYMTAQPPSVHHDTTNYGSSFDLGRGFLVAVKRYNVNADSDENQAIWVMRRGYNLAGEVPFSKDALGHQTSIGYADSFTDGTNLNTLAYPTTLTDADGYSASVQYN